VLRVEPVAREAWRELAHGRSAQLGRRAIGHERENARKLEDPKRVLVHSALDANDPNKRVVRRFGS
jgi:hypothetical protein